MIEQTDQAELGEISNRITDLTIQGAPAKKILPLVLRSITVMDRMKKGKR